MGASGPAVLIAGPTASGKTALAVGLAAALGGEVINADSMQVYRELSILTARPTAAEMAGVPHHLFGHVAAAELYTVARWLDEAQGALAEVRGRGRRPILVGGTGLYFSALVRGFSTVPAVPDDVRARWRERGAEIGPAGLHAILAERDPAMAARLRPTDPQRLLRALEVLEATGRSLADWQQETTRPLLGADEWTGIVLTPDRAELRARIARRFAAMAAAGGLEEAARLDALGLDPVLPSMRAIGVPEMIAAARGDRPVDDAVAAAITATRQYAKRQETWFRNQFSDWFRVDPLAGEGAALRAVLGHLRTTEPGRAP